MVKSLRLIQVLEMMKMTGKVNITIRRKDWKDEVLVHDDNGGWTVKSTVLGVDDRNWEISSEDLQARDWAIVG